MISRAALALLALSTALSVPAAADKAPWRPLTSIKLFPSSARPQGVVTQQGLQFVIAAVSREIPPQTDPPMTVTHPREPVNRLNAVAALVKLGVPPESVQAYGSDPDTEMPPDAAHIPAWGRSFVAAAMGEGWLGKEEAFHPHAPATWAFLDRVMAHLPISRSSADDIPPPVAPGTAAMAMPGAPGRVTGVVVDVSGIKVERAMSMRILDETGAVIYPESGHLPDIDYLMDHGLCSYCAAEPDVRRVGNHPLVVRALRAGVARSEDIVISSASAARILQANKCSHCLWRWSVCLISGATAAAPASAGKAIGQPAAQ